MKVTERRNASTLLPVFQNVALPGSIKFYDEWQAFQGIQGMGIDHKTMN